MARIVDGTFSRYRFKDALSRARFSDRRAAGLAGAHGPGPQKSRKSNGPTGPWAPYASENLFKLYLLDVGLLGAMAGLAPRDLLVGDTGAYKGWVAGNYVAQG